jgi:hypothetical protein
MEVTCFLCPVKVAIFLLEARSHSIILQSSAKGGSQSKSCRSCWDCIRIDAVGISHIICCGCYGC